MPPEIHYVATVEQYHMDLENPSVLMPTPHVASESTVLLKAGTKMSLTPHGEKA